MSEDNRKSILPVSVIDRRLIQSAARQRTPEEMSEDVLHHLTPAQCIDRVKEIIESSDVWSDLEARKLLMYQMQDHLDWLHDNKENDKVLSSIPRMYKLISESLDKSRINLDDVSTKLAAEHARFFAEGYNLGFRAILDYMKNRDDIVIDDDDEMELMQLGATASAEYLTKVTARGESV